MPATTDKTRVSTSCKDDIFLNGRCVYFGDGRSAADITTAMPTNQDYAQGMNKLRATIDCPVLSLDEQVLADELADMDVMSEKRNNQSRTDVYDNGLKNRMSVADFLKAQHRENLLKRLPRFEQDTINALEQLRLDNGALNFRLLVTNWLLVAAIIIGGLLWLL